MYGSFITPRGYDMWELIVGGKESLNEGLVATYPSASLIRYICDHFNLTDSNQRMSQGDNGYAFITTVSHDNSDKVAAEKITIRIFSEADEIIPDIEKNIGVFGWFISTDSREFVKMGLIRKMDYVELTLSQKVEYSECEVDELLNKYKHFVHITYTRNIKSIMESGLVPTCGSGLFGFNDRVHFFGCQNNIEPKDYINFMKGILLIDGYIDRKNNVSTIGVSYLKRYRDFFDFSIIDIDKNYFSEMKPVIFKDDKFFGGSAYFVNENIHPKYLSEVIGGVRIIGA